MEGFGARRVLGRGTEKGKGNIRARFKTGFGVRVLQTGLMSCLYYLPWYKLAAQWLTNKPLAVKLFKKRIYKMNTASKLGPHTQTDRGTCPGVGL
jgi:hypothetical protein